MNLPHLLIKYFPFVGKSSFCLLPQTKVYHGYSRRSSCVLSQISSLPCFSVSQSESGERPSRRLRPAPADKEIWKCRHSQVSWNCLQLRLGMSLQRNQWLSVLKWCPVLLCLQVLFHSFQRLKASWECLRSARMSVCGGERVWAAGCPQVSVFTRGH